MNNAYKLLTRLKAAHGGCSDYKAAQLLDITPQTISRIKNDIHGFSDVTLNKIAQLLDENPMLLIAEYHLETQDFPSMNNIWEHMKYLAHKEEMEKYQTLTKDGIGKVSGL